MQNLYDRLLLAVTNSLNNCSQQCEAEFITALDSADPEMSQEIKNRLFVFSDIILLDDAAIQKVLRLTTPEELTAALKNVSFSIRDKVLQNMSDRAQEAMKQNLEAFDPSQTETIECAQRSIVGYICQLEKTGEIHIQR